MSSSIHLLEFLEEMANVLGYIVPELTAQVEEKIKEEIAIVGELNELASQHPYYK